MRFNLRGEEYSAQIDDFVDAVRDGRQRSPNAFAAAAETDRTMALMLADRGAASELGARRRRPARRGARGAPGSACSARRGDGAAWTGCSSATTSSSASTTCPRRRPAPRPCSSRTPPRSSRCSTPPMTRACAPSCARPTTGSARSATMSARTRAATRGSSSTPACPMRTNTPTR